MRYASNVGSPCYTYIAYSYDMYAKPNTPDVSPLLACCVGHSAFSTMFCARHIYLVVGDVIPRTSTTGWREGPTGYWTDVSLNAPSGCWIALPERHLLSAQVHWTDHCHHRGTEIARSCKRHLYAKRISRDHGLVLTDAVCSLFSFI